MTRPAEELEMVDWLAECGLDNCEISRRTGIPRSTISGWQNGRRPGGTRRGATKRDTCIRCSGMAAHPFVNLYDSAYAYLLGIYLGDGNLTKHRRDVFRLNVSLDSRYALLNVEVASAIGVVMPENRVAIAKHPQHNLVNVNSYSKHWPCLFPQHGPGLKHKRTIELEGWQQSLVDRYPWRLVRGLIQSDGCRSLNTIKRNEKVYRYPRYQFSNRSIDIQRIFCETCDAVGVEWRQMNRWTISVARRDSVALMDRHIGPKR